MWLTNSSVGRKVVMSITGLFLVLFVTFHALMNAVAVLSFGAYDKICEFLGANWYALVATVGLVRCTWYCSHCWRYGGSHHLRFLAHLPKPQGSRWRPLRYFQKLEERELGISKHARAWCHRILLPYSSLGSILG